MERGLLAELEATGGPVVLTRYSDGRSMRESRKRAAHTLEAKGLAAVRRMCMGGRSRSVLMTMGDAGVWDVVEARHRLAAAESALREARGEARRAEGRL